MQPVKLEVVLTLLALIFVQIFDFGNAFSYGEVEKAYKDITSAGRTHSQLCIAESPGDAVNHFQRGSFFSNVAPTGSAVLVTTPCLGSDSLGNRLTDYFENLICAHNTGAHFVSVMKTWEMGRNHEASPLLKALPPSIASSHPRTYSDVNSSIEAECDCQSSCHERNDALIVGGIKLVKPLMALALSQQLHYLENNGSNGNSSSTNFSHTSGSGAWTVIDDKHHSTVPAGTLLPLIPDVAIHYRCGDNFVGYYGFLPFTAFPKYIPQSVRTIFVLAENRNRHSTARQHRGSKCDVILFNLFEYLKKKFPNASVVVRRGDDLYTDMVRLAYAKITVCSVSTFCLWSVIAREKGSPTYIPQSKVLFGGDTSVDLGFEWVTDPPLLLGKPHDHLPVPRLIQLLLREDAHSMNAAGTAP